MAEGKTGPNLQAGAGFLAKRVQKSLNRAQEKVLQKLGKTMETKDEQFELCAQSLNKQQMDGSRLFKDVRSYHAAVRAVHEASKRLSQTLRDVYEPEWDGVDELGVITESENLLWNDYEEKLSDQIVRTMENYTSQFPEVKERVSKRGRKLVDYDSARHHLEALQSSKKKDEAKIAKAEEEFNKTQSVFEEINKELREELPVLYQSRIGCYVTVFQNISNLRDVFYKEMSVLNRELYNVMKKLETQHSGKAFIIKGLSSSSTRSRPRKSLVISNPIPCNTAFPSDHVSLHSSSENGKDASPSSPVHTTHTAGEPQGEPRGEPRGEPQGEPQGEPLGEPENSSDSEPSSSDSTRSPSPDQAELTNQSDDSGVGGPQPEVRGQDTSSPSDSAESPDQENSREPDLEEPGEPKPPPVPAPRLSFRCTDRPRTAKTPQGEPQGEPQVEPQGEPQVEPQVPQGEPQGEPQVEPEGEPEVEPQVEPQGEPQGEPEEPKPTEPKEPKEPEVEPEVEPEEPKPKEPKEPEEPSGEPTSSDPPEFLDQTAAANNQSAGDEDAA